MQFFGSHDALGSEHPRICVAGRERDSTRIYRNTKTHYTCVEPSQELQEVLLIYF